ncbi:hypothetical protein Pan216_08560 [Planctomycetes bacterium Pan216]|uniref:Uncharacterized protein n=1 Tax=Kolteria novifilia TaxID=2527975 RepID=A0A518AZ80_9BACT|nr:hypothetical protein Pan216_08560 [Planctomycetes bacterium Pan216]
MSGNPNQARRAPATRRTRASTGGHRVDGPPWTHWMTFSWHLATTLGLLLAFALLGLFSQTR